MCRRAFAGFAMLVFWGGSLAAQDSAAALRRMEIRLDSLEQVLARRDSAAVLADISDTVTVGGLRIATSPRFRPIAQAAAEEAWAALQARFGISVEEATLLPVMRFGSARSLLPERPNVHELACGFAASATQAIWRMKNPEVLAWLQGSVPTGPLTASQLADVAEGMARVPAEPNRPCLSGNARACARALGIDLGPDTLAAWYAPAAWPRLAEDIGGNLGQRDALDRKACMSQGDQDACRTLLTARRLTPPVGMMGRQYLVQRALDLGGAAGFNRLAATGGASMEVRIAAAAGIPIDTLLLEWSAAVRASVPGGPARPGNELLLALAWSAGVLLLVATRSGRWR